MSYLLSGWTFSFYPSDLESLRAQNVVNDYSFKKDVRWQNIIYKTDPI